METIFSNLTTVFKNTFSDISTIFKFRKYTNTRKRKIDKHPYPNIFDGASKNITSKDLFYFTCLNTKSDGSYQKANKDMRNNDYTNVSSSAYKKKRSRKSYLMFKYMYEKLYKYYVDITTDLKSVKKYKETALVDGSHYTLYSDLMKDGLKSYNKGKTTKLTSTTILHQEHLLPICVGENLNNNEVQGFLDQLENLESLYIFIFDRLFYCEKVLKIIKEKKCDAIFRMKTGKFKITQEFIRTGKDDMVINVKNNKKVPRGTEGSFKLRLIRYTINDTIYVLGTTLLDKKKYDLECLKEMYRERWLVEDHFRVINYELTLKESRAKTLNTFKQEQYTKLIITTISKIVEFCAVKYGGLPLEINEKINFSNCIDSVINHILPLLLYGSDDMKTINQVIKHTLIIRAETVINKPDRHFKRRAVRTFNKWYYNGYIKEYHKEKTDFG